MEGDYYHSRLDKAKVPSLPAQEMLMASRRVDSPGREGEQKKKKKHKEDR
jgi:hypothetical protein